MRARALFLLPLLSAAVARGTSDRPLRATLTEAKGDVRVCAGPNADWEPAEAGAQLAADARLKTGGDGSADLIFEDGTSLHVEKNASLALQAAREGGGWREYWVRLWSGRLLSQVAKKDTPVRYRVQTPVAVAAVRGTEFVADAGEGDTQVAVFEGNVETQALVEGEDKPLGAAVTVSPDQEVALTRGRPAGPPRKISEGMQNYRRSAAALFRARMDLYRQDMGRVQKLQSAFMERRRLRQEGAMERRRRETEGPMKRFQKRMRRRAPTEPQ